MKILTILAALLLAGCGDSYTPQQVMEDGERFTARLAKPPKDAAYCVARAGENLHGTVSSNVRPMDGESMEVIFRIGVDPGRTISVVHLAPDGTGSRATIWWLLYKTEVVNWGETMADRDAEARRRTRFNDEGAAKMFKGC